MQDTHACPQCGADSLIMGYYEQRIPTGRGEMWIIKYGVYYCSRHKALFGRDKGYFLLDERGQVDEIAHRLRDGFIGIDAGRD